MTDTTPAGKALVETAMGRRAIGPYQLQGAIAALHSRPARVDGGLARSV